MVEVHAWPLSHSLLWSSFHPKAAYLSRIGRWLLQTQRRLSRRIVAKHVGAASHPLVVPLHSRFSNAGSASHIHLQTATFQGQIQATTMRGRRPEYTSCPCIIGQALIASDYKYPSNNYVKVEGSHVGYLRESIVRFKGRCDT